MLDFLADYPCRHGVNVEALYVTADPVCFKQRGTTTHKRVHYKPSGKIVCPKKRVGQRFVAKFRKHETSK